MSIEAMKQVKVFLEHLTTHTWTLADQQKAIELQSQAIAEAEKQEQDEPVIDKSAAIRIATALGWTPPKQEQGEPVAMYREKCADGSRCLHGCHTNERCYTTLQPKQEQGEPVALEPTLENSLPTWSECNLIIQNDDFRKRAEAGLEGQVLDTPRTTPVPTELHRFIHEYDDADPYRSAWFLHRLECVLKEAATPQQRKPLNDISSPSGNLVFGTESPQPTREPLTDEQYFEIGQRHWVSSHKVAQIHKEIDEAAHGIKDEA